MCHRSLLLSSEKFTPASLLAWPVSLWRSPTHPLTLTHTKPHHLTPSHVRAQETDSYLNVGKRISLFLARKSPSHTIDTLVYEIKAMRADDDALVTPKAAHSSPVGGD